MIDNHSVLAIIPARGGSKGIKRKNLREVNGKTLLAHTIETALNASLIDRVIVTSEDEEIINAAKSARAEVPFIRPKHLAEDDTPGITPILHAIDQLPLHDYTIVLQVTSPLRTVEDINDSLNFCIRNKAPACVSVSEPLSNPYLSFKMDNNHHLKHLFLEEILPRRQDYSPYFQLNGAIYIAKTDWLKKNKNFLSTETIGYVMPKERALDVDTEFDLQWLEFYLNQLNKKK